MKTLIAQAGVTIDGQEIKNPYLDPSINTLGDLINLLLPFIFGIAGIILLFVIIWGGYDFLLSQGEADKVSSARSKITAGIIGIVLLFLSYLIARVLAFVFGLDQGIL